MDDRAESKVAWSYKRQKVVENYDHLHPEGTMYINDDNGCPKRDRKIWYGRWYPDREWYMLPSLGWR